MQDYRLLETYSKDREGLPGTVIEMAEATPVRMRIFDQVREAALNWERRDPIRMSWPAG